MTASRRDARVYSYSFTLLHFCGKSAPVTRIDLLALFATFHLLCYSCGVRNDAINEDVRQMATQVY